jgi:ribosome-associated translation inhibitor RaiA
MPDGNVLHAGDPAERSAAGLIDVSDGVSPPVQVAVQGEVARGAVRYALAKVARVGERVDEPVLFIRVVLTQHGDPAAVRPAMAEAVVDVNGDLVRAHVAADEMMEAIDKLDARLRDRLDHHRAHRGWDRPGEAPVTTGEWRHGGMTADRPTHFDRPLDQREVVRHKTWASEEMTVDEAVCDLESLDHDFYLFRELLSGQDSVVYRVADGGYGLMQVDPDPRSVAKSLTDVVLNSGSAPRLSIADAIERLNIGEEPFVFFVPAESVAAAVAYRRFDGHYGLIIAEA